MTRVMVRSFEREGNSEGLDHFTANFDDYIGRESLRIVKKDHCSDLKITLSLNKRVSEGWDNE